MFGKPSKAQLKFVRDLAGQVGISFDSPEFKQAVSSGFGCSEFIKCYKPVADKIHEVRKKEAAQVAYAMEVRNGTCTDETAEIRGRALAEYLGMAPDKHDKFSLPCGTKTYAGFYRGAVRALIECHDV
jgi:hypothetical protein